METPAFQKLYNFTYSVYMYFCNFNAKYLQSWIWCGYEYFLGTGNYICIWYRKSLLSYGWSVFTGCALWTNLRPPCRNSPPQIMKDGSLKQITFVQIQCGVCGICAGLLTGNRFVFIGCFKNPYAVKGALPIVQNWSQREGSSQKLPLASITAAL